MAIDTALAFLSLSETKQFLKIPDATVTEDDVIGDIVNGVADWINKYCGRVFLSTTYTEYYDGDGTDYLQLRKFPVTAITTIYDDINLRTFGADTLISSSDYYLEGDPGIVRLYNGHAAFNKGTQNIKVVYVAGYLLAAIPQAIQLASKEMVSLVYRNTYQQWRLGIATESIGDRTIALRDEEIPSMIKSMLNPYRVLMG